MYQQITRSYQFELLEKERERDREELKHNIALNVSGIASFYRDALTY